MADLVKQVPITCPKCHHEFTKTLADLEREPEFACPGNCGVSFESKQFLLSLKEANKIADDFRRDLGNTL